MQAVPFLETERLIIRNWRVDDWLLVRPMSLDPDVMQYIGHYQPWSEQETRQFVSNRIADYKRHGWTMWPLVLKETGAFIGYCGFLRHQYGEYCAISTGSTKGRSRSGMPWQRMRGAEGLRRRRVQRFSSTDSRLSASTESLPAQGRRMQGRSA